jgi:hypothetical protein
MHTSAFDWAVCGLSVVAIASVMGCAGSQQPMLDAGSGADAGLGAGWGGDGGCGPVSWDQDVFPIVQAYCMTCHDAPPNYGAPVSLTTYAATQQPSVENNTVLEYQMMASKLSSGLMPASGPKPTPEEIALVVAWADAGAPLAACPGTDAGMFDAGTVDAGDAGLVDTSTANFKGTANGFVDGADAGVENNEFRCFSFTLDTGGQSVEALEFAPIVDNSRILHHMIAFRINSPQTLPSSYDCFGGPSPAGMQLSASFLYGWAPGVGPWQFPTGVGMPLQTGDQLVIQIHYHNFTGEPQTDSSGLAIWWTTQQQTYQASVLRLGPTGFVLEPQQEDAQVVGQCLMPQTSATLLDFGAAPHEHLFGTEVTTQITSSGTTSTLVTVDPWNFNAQQIYPENQIIHPGDQLVTTCHYNTMTAMGPVPYGETTEDEMCFDFLYVYPLTTGSVPGTCNN